MAEEKNKVLCMCLVVIVCLSCGCIFLKVTTDPVELWSPANSLGRKQKNFFDNNFGPFYRTNQVFIKAIGIEKVSYVIEKI